MLDSDLFAPMVWKHDWCHPQNWKYFTYRSAIRRTEPWSQV